jgi:hypothetical protein
MSRHKINTKSLLALVIILGTLCGVNLAAPRVSAAVDQKYVKECKNYFSNTFCTTKLKQAWVDACTTPWKQANKRAWSGCINTQAKKDGVVVASGSIPGAQDPATNFDSSPCTDPSNCNIVTDYVNPFINKFLAPMAILAVIIGVIWGSVEYTTSGGDPQRVASAKAHIQKALIGLVSFMFLYALLNWLMPGGLI